MSSAYVLAVDQSTAATKACLFDPNGVIRYRATVEHTQYYPQPGWVEHDPLEIVERTHQAIEAVVHGNGIDETQITAVGISNQRETIVAWDRHTGMPVHNALVWQDERGTPICEQLVREGKRSEIEERTGLVIDSYFSASKLQWLLENVPACKHAADAGSLMAGTIDTWLVWNFTDHDVFATDYSNAGRTLLFNIHTLRWDAQLLELFRLPPSLGLPDVRYADDDFGRYRFRRSGKTVPIVGVMGDSHAALYGHTGFSEGDAKTTFGTGSSVMMNVGGTIKKPVPGIVTSIGWGIGGTVTYVYEGNIHHTGDTVRWARDQLRLFQDFDEAEQRAAAVGATDGVYLVPAFSGLGAPHWTHGIRAAITGMSRSTTADHIIRAVLESIVYQVVDVISAMNADGTFRLPALMVDGGASRNGFVMQLLADVLGVPVHVAEIEEVSARGVAFVAGSASGLWKNEAALRECVRPHTIYSPKMDETRRHALLDGWRTAVEQVLAGRRGEH